MDDKGFTSFDVTQSMHCINFRTETVGLSLLRSSHMDEYKSNSG